MPNFYPVGTRANCPIPSIGKYWAYRFGVWHRVLVQSLPEGGGTGCMVYAPIDRRGYPYDGGCAVSNCQVFYGPLKVWGDKEPRASKKKLLELGASPWHISARKNNAKR